MIRMFRSAFSAVKNFFITVFTTRNFVLGFIFLAMFGVLLARIFYLQIIKADYYADNFTQKSERTIYYDGARGDIYDCNGKLLAHNEIAYSVYMTDLIPSSDTKGQVINGIIYDAIGIIEANGDKIIEDFNIEIGENGEYRFKDDPVTPKMTFLCNVFGLSSDEIFNKGYDAYSADKIIEYMCSDRRFDISDEYPPEVRLKICTIRYALSLNSYQKYIATEIATDVNEKTRAAISEGKAELTGIEIGEYYKRVYDEGKYAAALLGYTGQISEEEILELNESNELNLEYTLGDIVGKTGIEKSYDAYLQGTRGEDVVFVDAKGNVIETVSSKKSGSGNDVYLTIDIDLQKAAFALLEQEIAGILASKIVDWDYIPEENADIIYIPVNDVYYKLLTNVIDTREFMKEDASEREVYFRDKFNEKQTAVIEQIRTILNDNSQQGYVNLTPEYSDYMYFIYDFLDDIGVLQKEVIDQNNDIYINWANESITLREFILGAISENWIDSSMLSTDIKYPDSTQIYNSIVDIICEELPKDRDFADRLYYYMVYNGNVSGYDICMMLYDQDCIPNDNGMKERLQAGDISAYSFILSQINDLVITPDMVALDPCSGSLIITDSASGKVKAMVSYPAFDNNNLSGRIDMKYWEQLQENDSLPLFNRATQALTAPGSTFKPLTSIVGLKEGVITPATIVYDEGVFERVTPSPKCWISPGTHGEVDLPTALQVSCNYYFYTVGYYLGFSDQDDQTYNSGEALEKMENYATQVGLAVKSGVEIEESDPRFSTTDSVRTAIGQGKNGFTTSQMGRYVNTVSQRGKDYQLSMIDRVVNKKGATIKKVDPVLTNTIDMPEDDWAAITAGMLRVTTMGTAAGVFATSDVEVAGKTGTAQENKYRSNHATFIGFSPYLDPQVSFACIIRNADSSTYPAELCNDVLRYYYGYTKLDNILKGKAKQITLETSVE